MWTSSNKTFITMAAGFSFLFISRNIFFLRLVILVKEVDNEWEREKKK